MFDAYVDAPNGELIGCKQERGLAADMREAGMAERCETCARVARALCLWGVVASLEREESKKATATL